MMNNLTNTLEQAAEFFSSRPEIDLAYLFGSVVKGHTHALSDIDFAVLTNIDQVIQLDKEKSYSYQTFLATSLMAIFRCDDVDLVLLHRAPPLLRFQVVRYGQVLYCRDERIRVHFEVNTRREYLDTQPLRAIKRKYLYQSIKEGRFSQKRAGT
jgi:hypothetical protein